MSRGPLVPARGTVLVSRAGEEIVVGRTYLDPGREPQIEMHHRDRQTRSFLTPSELAWMLRTNVWMVRRPSQRDPKLDKRKLWKTIDKDLKTKARAKVNDLREDVRRARKLRSESKEKARERCLRERLRARERGRAIREKAKLRARAIVDRARQDCKLSKAWSESTRETVRRARTALETERAHQRSMRQIERSQRGRLAGIAKTKVRERAGESDDEVRQNIDPSLVPLFNKVKRQIRASSRKSRTEAFLQYVEENPRERDHAIEDATDALIRQLESRQRRGR